MRHRPRRLIIPTATAALLLSSACGGDVAPSLGNASTTTGAQGTTPSVGGTSTTQPGGRDLICENPPPEEVGLGSTIAAEIDDDRPIRCFWVQVPEGLSGISFELTGLGADLVLNVGYGFLDAVQYHIREFWRSNEDGTADEVVAIENPQPGPYYLTVGPSGFGDFSPFELRTTTTPEMTAAPTGAAVPDASSCVEPATEIELGSSISSEVVARDAPAEALVPEARVYFCVQVPDGLGSLTVDVTELEENLNLLVRLVSANQQWITESGDGERSVIVENPAPGAYYIDVASSRSGSSSTFTLTVGSS
jgi:hypothetical protein